MAKNIDYNSPVDLINNEFMIYDEFTHQYVLTEKGIDIYTGETISTKQGSIANANIRLRQLSTIVYTYMYSKMTLEDASLVEWRISRDTDLANALYKAMGELYIAHRLSGAMNIYYQHGTNTGVSAEDLKAVKVPLIVHDILEVNTLLVNRYGKVVPDNIYRVGY